MKPSSKQKMSKDKQLRASPRSSKAPLPRGAFVHRMGEMPEDENTAAEFWRLKGFAVKTLENPSERYSRLPDLLLSLDGQPWAYCEVKTIWRHSWTVRVLHEGQTSEERHEATDRPVDERVSGDLVSALRQLHAANADHGLLNLVILVNRDPEASHSVISRLLCQSPPGNGRSLTARRAARLADELQTFRRDVDLCIWAKGIEGGFTVDGYFLLNPRLEDSVKMIAGLGSEQRILLEPAA